MKENININPVVSVVLLLAFILLVKIGSAEVQPWDEGLYAIRAQSILYHEDAFFDQSGYSPGGLYSGTYPPLTVWAIAASMSVFGENEFSLRLFSALCSLASLVLVSLIARRVSSGDNWLAAPIILFVSLAWNTYSRQGMTDVPLVFFFLLCFYSLIKGMETEEKKEIFMWAAIFMLGFSCALMTKIIKSMLPLMFIILLIVQKGYKPQKLIFAIMSLTGLFIGSLWYIFMAARHGADFAGALLVPHLYSAVEGNTKGLGILYYLNQIIISNPLFLFTIVLSIVVTLKKKWQLFGNGVKDYIYITSLVWFVAVFSVFSLSVTKLYHYTIYLLPSLALLSLILYEKQDTLKIKPKFLLAINLSLLAALAWSVSFTLRTGIKDVVAGEFSTPVLLFFLLASIVILVPIILNQQIATRLMFSLRTKLPLVILAVLFVRVILSNTSIEPGFSQGAKALSQSISKFHTEKFIYVYHSFTPADSLNPQLAWYSGDYMRGWDKNKGYIHLGLKKNTFDIKVLRKIDSYPDYPLIYYISDDKEITVKVIKDIMETRNPIRKEKNYVLFGIKRYDRNKGITI